MMMKRGPLLLGIPAMVTLGLFTLVSSLRKANEWPAPQRVVRIVDGREIVAFEPAPAPRTRPEASALLPAARPGPRIAPAPQDIETAAELSRIQSTFENYRTAVMTQNESLERSLLEVLRRDREAAMACARRHAAWAPSESERAFALKALAELGP